MGDRRPLDEPVELAIRGDRMDVLGFIAGVDVALNGTDDLGGPASRGGQVASQVMDAVDREENLELFRRDLEKAIINGGAPEFRGTDVVYRPFDPKHPDPDLDVEHLPPLDEVDHYLVFAYDETGFYAAGYPETQEPLEGFAFASFLRTYARDLEGAIEATTHGVDEEDGDAER